MKKYKLKLTMEVSYEIDPSYYIDSLLMQDILNLELEKFKEYPADYIHGTSVKYSGNIEKKQEVE